MDSQQFIILFLSITWGGPIGLGFLLMGLGVYYWGKSLDRRSKQADNS